MSNVTIVMVSDIQILASCETIKHTLFSEDQDMACNVTKRHESMKDGYGFGQPYTARVIYFSWIVLHYILSQLGVAIYHY